MIERAEDPPVRFDTSERQAILSEMDSRSYPAVIAVLKLVEENRQLRAVIAAMQAPTFAKPTPLPEMFGGLIRDTYPDVK